MEYGARICILPVLWPRVHICGNIFQFLFYIFNVRFTLNCKLPMLSKPTSRLQSRIGAREGGSNAMDTHILWFPTGVWVSGGLFHAFWCFYLFMRVYKTIFFYLSILLYFLRRVLSFVESFEATLNREKMILFFLILFSWVTANQASAYSPEFVTIISPFPPHRQVFVISYPSLPCIYTADLYLKAKSTMKSRFFSAAFFFFLSNNLLFSPDS